MSIENPVIMSISLGFVVEVSNSKVTMIFVQLHYFLSQNIGGQKILCPSPFQKLGRTCPPLNSIPAVADCARDAEYKKEAAKKQFGRQRKD